MYVMSLFAVALKGICPIFLSAIYQLLLNILI